MSPPEGDFEPAAGPRAPDRAVLLAHGADANRPLQTWTPTRRSSDDWNFAPELVGATPFWLAARFTQPAVMAMLLRHGADPKFVHHGERMVEGRARALGGHDPRPGRLPLAGRRRSRLPGSEGPGRSGRGRRHGRGRRGIGRLGVGPAAGLTAE